MHFVKRADHFACGRCRERFDPARFALGSIADKLAALNVRHRLLRRIIVDALLLKHRYFFRLLSGGRWSRLCARPTLRLRKRTCSASCVALSTYRKSAFFLSTNPIPCVPNVVLDCEGTGNGAVPGNSSATYTWGTNRHPVKYTSGVSTNWLHWNPAADNMLFENGPGLQTDLAIDRLGVSNASNGVTVDDRDPFGAIASTHTSLEFGPWASAPTQRLNPKTGITRGGAGSQYPYPGQDAQYASRLLDAGRPDAYIDGLYGISFQGVRSVDVNTGQWMSLDAFGGYSDAPISEQPYLWENNNWLAYTDPSGLDSQAVSPPDNPNPCPGATGGYVWNGSNWETDCFGLTNWVGGVGGGFAFAGSPVPYGAMGGPDLRTCIFSGAGDVLCPDAQGGFTNDVTRDLCKGNSANIGCSVIPKPKHPECIPIGIVRGAAFGVPTIPFLPRKMARPVGAAITVGGAIYGGVKLGWQKERCNLNPFAL